MQWVSGRPLLCLPARQCLVLPHLQTGLPSSIHLLPGCCLGSEGDQGIFILCAAGGLTENDFIMAAKINQLEFSDLYAPKKKRTFFY